MEISNRERNQYLKNAKVKVILFFLFVFAFNFLNAQIKVSGVILNSDINPISLGWIKSRSNAGVMTSLKGEYKISLSEADTLLFGCYGYKTKKVFIDKSVDSLIIVLKNDYLQFYYDFSNSDSAKALIKAVANKLHETKYGIDNSCFVREEKILIDTQNVFEIGRLNKVNNRTFRKVLKLCSTPLLYSDMVGVCLGEKTGCFEKKLRNTFTNISIEQFNINDKSFDIGEAKYLNPLYVDNVDSYSYSLESYFTNNNDTVASVVFKSKKNNYNPISGYVYILKNQLKVSGFYFYSTIYSHPLGVVVGQIFENSNNFYNVKSAILSIDFHKKLAHNLRPVTIATLTITDSKNSTSSIIRGGRISTNYQGNDKLFANNLNLISNSVNRYINNEITISGINLRPQEFIGYNEQEKYIYGVSFITNSQLSKLFGLGGRFYSSTGEKKMRYNFKVYTFPLFNNSLQFIYQYKNQTEEIGKCDFSNKILYKQFDFRSLVLPKVNNIRGHLLKIKYRYKNSTISFTGTNQEVIDYIDTANQSSNFDYTSLKLSLNYKNINKSITINNNTIPLSTSFPTVNISVEQGVDKHFTRVLSEINYKYLFDNNNELYIKANSGVVFGTFPVQLSFNGKGSRGVPFYNFGTFQTMSSYQFFNDHFVNLFAKISRTTANIDNELQIKFSTQLNVGYGDMYNGYLKNYLHSNSRGFYEMGFLVDIITPSINNISLGCFYNVGSYMKKSFKNDFAFVIGLRTWLKD